MRNLGKYIVKQSKMNTSQSGFTLIELLVSIAVLLILLGLAAPSFSAFIEKGEIDSVARKMSSALHFARSIAVERNNQVTVCGGTADLGCGQQWSNGVIVFIDVDGDQNYNAAKDDLLQVVHIRTNSVFTPFAARIAFDSRGFLVGSATSLSVCATSGSGRITGFDVLKTGGLAVFRKNASGKIVDINGNDVVCA